ncbi:MAG: leucine-rich repeat domain-containing protein, partial [Eubacteriales bacterium]|nr:leucine-rich repeat domain-containing protein [Eubacteriales bacterium]
MTNKISTGTPASIEMNSAEMNSSETASTEANSSETDPFEMHEMEIVWTLSEEGCLFVTGVGKMPDYSCGKQPDAPWKKDSEKIREIRIGEGITRIGINAFADCANLNRVSLPGSIRAIGAYAFRNCVALREIVSAKTEYRYLYEPRAASAAVSAVSTNKVDLSAANDLPGIKSTADSPESVSSGADRPDSSVTFGIGAFYNTVWALRRWGSFYCAGGILYATFVPDRHLIVPDTVRGLHRFAFAGTSAAEITLPETLESIDDFAFYGCPVRKIEIPSSVKEIGLSAFTNSSLKSIEFPHGLGEIRFIREKEDNSDRPAGNAPDNSFRMPGFYRISLKGYHSCPVFQRTLLFEKALQPEKKQIRKKKTAADTEYGQESAAPFAAEVNREVRTALLDTARNKPEETVLSGSSAAASEEERKAAGTPCILYPADLPFAKAIHGKMLEGDIYLCVEYDDKKVLCVKSYALNAADGHIKAYRMRPARNVGLPIIWEDSYEFLDKKAFLEAMDSYGFHSPEGEIAASRGIFRRAGDKKTSEWFRCAKRGGVLLDGELELNLLDLWMKYHSGKRVNTAEENMLEDENARINAEKEALKKEKAGKKKADAGKKQAFAEK